MIRSKEDLRYYLDADRIALKISPKTGLLEKIYARFIVPNYIWEYQKSLRISEYYRNCKRGWLGRIQHALAYRRFCQLGVKLGFTIPENSCGPGLALMHYGCIAVAQKARVGDNCRIQQNVTIGIRYDNPDRGPRIGNDVYIGAGAKIIGDIEIADGIAIGANAVVTKSFTEPGITIAGAPARKISHNGSRKHLIKGTQILREQYRNPQPATY